jgi:type I restriction enzyme M protein
MSNETAGEHYTPREVISLMVDLLLGPDSGSLAGVAPVRKVYDPAAGTGGMLSIAKARMTGFNKDAIVQVSGQELNPETWAIARSELMMRGDDPTRLAPGNSLTEDAFPGEYFDYMLANPPYGVDWKKYAEPIRAEAARGGPGNRFAAGLPRISDGSLLFLQHMISKMKPVSAAGGGSRIAIVLSGSPLFAGSAGSGESEIRRWIIENDWLEGIVGLPDQMFYNTGISTYVWIVTNRKAPERRGLVTLVDAREMGSKMRKSLGDKRKELTDAAIEEIATLFAESTDSNSGDDDPAGTSTRVRVMRNEEFGFARLTVERPLRRVYRMDVGWSNLNVEVSADVEARAEALARVGWASENAARKALFDVGLEPKQITTVLKAIATTDPDAEPVAAKKGGGYEPDTALRDQENIPLPEGYLEMSEAERILAVQEAAEKHLENEIRPYVPDAWIDHTKTKIGYEIPFTRQFYVYEPPRPVAEIRAEIVALEAKIQEWMRGVVG